MSALADFLLAQFAADERNAPPEHYQPLEREWEWCPAIDGGDCECNNPRRRARVLADVAAKTAIVELHDPGQHSGLCATCSEGGPGYDNSPLWFPCPTIRILALPYADHEDFDESWRP